MTVPTTEANAFDHRSLHERIAADLRDETMSGDLGPGAKLPSTVQLKARFDASNATVQKALQLLKDERLVIGRAGAAVTVREHRQRTMRPASYMAPAAAGAPYRWLTEAAKHGVRAGSRLLDVGEAVPPADVSAALNLPEGRHADAPRRVGVPASAERGQDLGASSYAAAVHGTSTAQRSAGPADAARGVQRP